MATASKPHVLIVGAGLGGLTLAQALRKQDVSFEIFERSSNTRTQGWAIGIHSMLGELVSSFPDDMAPITSVDHFLPLSLPAQIIYYRNNALLPRIGVQDDGDKSVIRANRQRFREWLATNIPIQFNKTATRVEEGDGSITVHFQDGTTATGDIVIGADGVHSAIRRHLLPAGTQDPVRLLPMVNLVGELVLEGREFERQLDLGYSAYIATDAGLPNSVGSTLFVGLRSVNPDAKSGNYYWCLTYEDAAAAEGPHWTTSASKEALYDLAVKKTQHLIQDFRHIIEKTGPEGMMTTPLVLRDLELDSLPSGRVTLLGDAAHCMTPFRGEGGVHAMRDALKLSRAIASIARGGAGIASVNQALGEYQQEMLERGGNAVRLSRGNWAGSSSGTREGWGKPIGEIPRSSIRLSDIPLVSST